MSLLNSSLNPPAKCLTFAFVLLLFGPFFALPSVLSQSSSSGTVLYLFWGNGCPHCAAEKAFLENLKGVYPELEIQMFEIYNNEANRDLFKAMSEAFGQEAQAVPTTILADNYWVGFSAAVAENIQAHVEYCLEYKDCPDPIKRLNTDTQALLAPLPSEENTLELPWFGSIHVHSFSLALSTALIALVDGFNPCSLWVLSILLAVVLHTGSRRKVLWIGSTFLLIAALAYGLFIAGLFNILSIAAYLYWIQSGVALIALTFAVINIKDYFWYKKGVSLTISENQKPRIYKGIRNIMAQDKSFVAALGATGILAFSVTLIELPCTAGLPMLWTSLMAEHRVSTAAFWGLLGLYLLIFIFDELLIFASAVFSLKVSRLEEKHGRFLKLLSGMVMLALAIIMLLAPELMQNLLAALSIFAVAVITTLLIHWISRSFQAGRKPSLHISNTKKTR